jgi:hypothetical protein
LLSRALLAKSFTAFEIDTKPRRSALGTIGVMSPAGVDTATEISTESNL